MSTSRPQRRMTLVGILLAVAATTIVAAPAASAADAAACVDGSRPSAPAVGDADHVVEPLTATAADEFTGTVKLRYAPEYGCAWALVAGHEGVTVWLDRSFDDGAHWEGPLGRRTVRGGNDTTYTAPSRVGSDVAVRACGTGAHLADTVPSEEVRFLPGEVACTPWFSTGVASAPQTLPSSTSDGVVLPASSVWSPDKKLYVALGDSYSAGEGAPAPPLGADAPADFLAGTRTDVDSCHRSTASYAVAVWRGLGTGWGLDFAACSGATTENYVRPQNDLAPAQRAVLQGRMADLVTLTMGGNDIGFKTIGQACVTTPRGCDLARDKVAGLVSGLRSNLSAVYGDIGEHVKASGRLIVIGYPRPFRDDPTGSCGSGVVRSFTRSDMIYVNSLVDSINRQVELAASDQLLASYVDVSDVYQTGDRLHDLCVNESDQRWINRIDVYRLEYSLHPTAEAHDEIARRVMRCIDERQSCLPRQD